MKIDFRVLIIGIAAIFLFSQLSAQPYASIGFTNKGVNGGIGMLAGGIDLNIQYDHPMSSVDKPALLAFTVGKQFLFNEKEYSHWNITTSIGYVNCTYKDLSLYDTQDKITKVSEFRPVYLAEIGYNSNLGRISFVVKRCETMYYGATMRCFFYR